MFTTIASVAIPYIVIKITLHQKKIQKVITLTKHWNQTISVYRVKLLKNQTEHQPNNQHYIPDVKLYNRILEIIGFFHLILIFSYHLSMPFDNREYFHLVTPSFYNFKLKMAVPC